MTEGNGRRFEGRVVLVTGGGSGLGEAMSLASGREALALHLCSDEAAYTTGQIVSPNGGIRM